MSATRRAIHGLGELLVTIGLVLLLFCVYQLVWTNIEANRKQDSVSQHLADDWRKSRPTVTPQAPLTLGKGFAFLRIPRLGRKFDVPVIEGVRSEDLSRGVGHYRSTARPGEVGNFAVAGHRATNGEPFRDLDRMRRGDKLVVETETTWYTYVVDRTRIVAPTDVWVLDPVPGRPEATPTKQLLTLTTCNPRWASTERLIVFSHLEETKPKSAGRPTALAVGL
ncbi:MAG: class E sortase [Sporichthyaceae bacterium]